MEIQIVVSYLGYRGNEWQAVSSEWDLGDPMGHASSIQQAIDNLLEGYEMKNINITKYTWK